MRIFAAFALSALSWSAWSPAPARAEDIDLAWHAPEACPSRESLRESLEQRLGRPVRLSSEARVGMAGVVEVSGRGYKLDLRTHSEDVSDRRELHARSCNELARASLLVLELLLVQGPASPPTAAGTAGVTEPSGPRLLRFTLRASVLVDIGAMPRLAVGPALALGLWWRRWQFELAGDFLPAQSSSVSSGGRRAGRLQVWAGSAVLCHALLEQPALGPCVGLEVGRLSWTSDVTKPAHTSGTWLLSQIGLRLGVALGAGVFWDVQLGIGVALNRIEIRSSDLGELFYRTPFVLGRASTGLLARF